MPLPPATGRLAFILNPRSGTMGETDEVTTAIRDLLPAAEIITSREAGGVESAAAQARDEGIDIVIAAGGDGTLNEVVNGVLACGRPVTLGLLPFGTGNDFARTLELPLALHAALAIIHAGHCRALDVVRVSGSRQRWMINVSAGGFAGLVNEKLTPEIKAAWGPLSYFRGMVEALGEMQAYAARVTVDDLPAEDLMVLNLVVANASYVARGIPIAPPADPGDGFIDLVAIRDSTLAQLALLTPRVLAGAHLDHESVLHLRGRRIHISSTPAMTFNTDGETFGEGEITFEVRPGLVRFLAPPAIPSSQD